ncbi:MAG: hypothetical protein U5L96_17670 [Owenweeksia sp.]|nr:hypothetical protein [Owenweeksia sp.]
MAGVLYFHLTDLGIVVQNDGGKLFTLAIVVLIAALVVLGLTMRRTRSKIGTSSDHKEYNN